MKICIIFLLASTFTFPTTTYSLTDKTISESKAYGHIIKRIYETNIDPTQKNSDSPYSLDIIGNTSPPFSWIKQTTYTDNKLSFSIIYQHGELGMRLIPDCYSPKNANRHLVVAGDSNTFGEGVNVEDTLPVQLARQFPKTHPYNFGQRGAGPNSTLAMMEFFPWANTIKEDDGIFIYNYYEFLRERVIGTRSVIEWNLGFAPYYLVNDEGEAVYQGPFNDRLLTKFFKLVNLSQTLRELLPVMPKPNHSDSILIGKIFLKMHNLYKEKFPKGKFYVAINKFYGSGDIVMLNELEEELKKNKVPFFIIPSTVTTSSDDVFPDGHLNKLGHKKETQEFLKVFPFH